MQIFIHIYRLLKETDENNLLNQTQKYDDLRQQYDQTKDVLERFCKTSLNWIKYKIYYKK